VPPAGSLPVLLLIELLAQLLVQELTLVVVANRMIRVREPGQLQLLRVDATTHQQITQSSRILEVHVVVAGAVLNEEGSSKLLKTGHIMHRRLGVAVGVEFGRLHVTLGVHGIVERPA